MYTDHWESWTFCITCSTKTSSHNTTYYYIRKEMTWGFYISSFASKYTLCIVLIMNLINDIYEYGYSVGALTKQNRTALLIILIFIIINQN